jgi:hypothetical protein
LREFIDAVPKAAVRVVRNGYFGEERKFELYNGSKIREEVESRGGKSITLPDLADRVADDIYVRRISLKVAALFPIGNRAKLWRWRGDVQCKPNAASRMHGRRSRRRPSARPPTRSGHSRRRSRRQASRSRAAWPKDPSGFTR